MDREKSSELLKKELGASLFKTLTEPENMKKVRWFARKLYAQTATKMKIGDRTYEIIDIVKQYKEKGESLFFAWQIVKCARQLNIMPDKNDAVYLIDHRDEIPEAFNDNIGFLFPGSVEPHDYEVKYCQSHIVSRYFCNPNSTIYVVDWSSVINRWSLDKCNIEDGFNDTVRLLRRIS